MLKIFKSMLLAAALTVSVCACGSGSSGGAGATCAVTTEGAKKCSSKVCLQVTCNGSTKTPSVCTGAECTQTQTCPTGQECVAYQNQAFCVPSNVCN